jgi:hypothetical protein
MKTIDIKLPKEFTEMLKSMGSVVNSPEGFTHYHLPYLFKETEKEDVYEVTLFEKFPDNINVFLNKYNTEINKIREDLFLYGEAIHHIDEAGNFRHVDVFSEEASMARKYLISTPKEKPPVCLNDKAMIIDEAHEHYTLYGVITNIIGDDVFFTPIYDTAIKALTLKDSQVATLERLYIENSK